MAAIFEKAFELGETNLHGRGVRVFHVEVREDFPPFVFPDGHRERCFNHHAAHLSVLHFGFGYETGILAIGNVIEVALGRDVRQIEHWFLLG